MFFDGALSEHRSAMPARLICWSRMQAEAGQELEAIVARKELERQVNGGVFMWGVGNAPGSEPARLAREGVHVDLILSVMKSKPKQRDQNPGGLLVWTRYIDERGKERELPAGSLVTSRAPEPGARSRGHYALMAHCEQPLRLGDLGSFNPAAYRNVGGRGAQVGSSQVTALLRLTAPDAVDHAGYRAAIRATLVGGYWVRLAEPIGVTGSALAELREELGRKGGGSAGEWAEAVGSMRKGVGRRQIGRGSFDGVFARQPALI